MNFLIIPCAFSTAQPKNFQNSKKVPVNAFKNIRASLKFYRLGVTEITYHSKFLLSRKVDPNHPHSHAFHTSSYRIGPPKIKKDPRWMGNFGQILFISRFQLTLEAASGYL